MSTGALAQPNSEETNTISLLKSLAVSPSETSNARLRVLLEDFHPTQLPKLSHRMRAWSGFGHPFDEITPKPARQLLDICSDRTAVAAALSMHRDGRVREAAVQSLDGTTDPLALPFVLLRCGDWVEVVRLTALRSIQPWIETKHIDTLLRSFPLLSGGRFERGRPSQHMPENFIALFKRPDSGPALMRNAGSGDPVTRRAATRLLVDRGATIELLEQTVTTGDIVAIGLAARALPTDGSVNERAGEILLGQRSPRLRQEGLFRLLKAQGPDARPLARTFLLDHALNVRSTAQQWFSDDGGDAMAYYRSLGPERRRAALLGLGDRADPQDAVLARDSLTAPPRTRRAALRLLAKLGGPDDYDTFTDCLLHGPEREMREALIWFGKSGQAKAALDSIWTLSTTECSAIRVLFRLAPLTDNWTQLRLGLRACSDSRPPVRDAAVLLVRRASSQPSGFLTPSPERLSELRSLLQPARSYLDAQPARWGRPTLSDRVAHLLRSR